MYLWFTDASPTRDRSVTTSCHSSLSERLQSPWWRSHTTTTPGRGKERNAITYKLIVELPLEQCDTAFAAQVLSHLGQILESLRCITNIGFSFRGHISNHSIHRLLLSRCHLRTAKDTLWLITHRLLLLAIATSTTIQWLRLGSLLDLQTHKSAKLINTAQAFHGSMDERAGGHTSSSC